MTTFVDYYGTYRGLTLTDASKIAMPTGRGIDRLWFGSV